jgi:hypothetical protein
MIETIKDLDLDSLDLDDELLFEKIDEKLKEKLSISLEEMTSALRDFVIKRAEELVHDMPNIAPYNDYETMLEDNDSMALFLKNEASKLENWRLMCINEDPKNKSLIKFTFNNKAVDDGDILSGLVFVSKSGKIRHAFAQADS